MGPDAQRNLVRGLALAAGFVALGAITWIGTIPKGIDGGDGYIESTGQASSGYQSGGAPVVYREVKTGREPCSSFQDSPYAVEAMIDEMVNRGWKPPSQQEALASTQPRRGAPITAVDPNTPVPVVTPRQSAPADSTAPAVNGEPAAAASTAPAVTPPPVEPAPPTSEPAPKAPV